MASKGPNRKGALQQAKEYLRVNPSATNSQVVEALDISSRTVTTARAWLVQNGHIAPSYFDRTSGRNRPLVPADEPPTGSIGGTPLATEGPADFGRGAPEIESILGEALTPEEQRKRLSAVARTAATQGNLQVEIAAIQALARLDAQQGAQNRLGPGPPLDDDAKIHRLSLLIEACGKRITKKAWERAFNEQFPSFHSSPDRHEPRELGSGADVQRPEAPLAAPEDDSPRAEDGAGASATGGSDPEAVPGS